MKKRNKKGQYYLIAGIVIAGIVMGIVSTSTSIKKEFDIEISDLKQEIITESRYIIDYGLYNGHSFDVKYNKMIEFSKNYSDYLGKDKNLYFIFGNENNLTISGYQNSNRIVSLNSGNSNLVVTEILGEFEGSIIPEENYVIVNIGSNEHNFSINSGDNFYFIISKIRNQAEQIIVG